MAAKPPDAFLSYTRFDDGHDGGAISEFCRRLASAVRAVTGVPFEIFQDVEGIGLGEHWLDKLDEMLNEARFFIPILTPSFFRSGACRDELEKFSKAEKDRGRTDLVLPIYYIRCRVLEDPSLRKDDPLASAIHERQWEDWRERRYKRFEDPEVRISLEALAYKIDEARSRAEEKERERAEAERREKEEEARQRAEAEARRKEEVKARRQAAAAEAERFAEEKARMQAEQEAGHKAEEEARRRAAAAEAEHLAQEEARKRAEQEARRKTTEEATKRVAEARQRVDLAEVKRLFEEVERRAEKEAHDRIKQPVARSRPMRPGTVFRDVDAKWWPELVVIPPGEFMMGSTAAERRWAVEHGAKPECVESEKRQHLVRIAYALAVGRYPVTFKEYGHFAGNAGRAQPGDQGWGGGRKPVINVDWEDAKAFVAWLSVRTGQAYRLLSEAEWEHACRAGTTTRFWWGDEITPGNANYLGYIGQTTKVGCYGPNAWGLYDVHGNVWEWVEDRWHDSYAGAPDDGSAWIAGTDSLRVLRGGSWHDEPGCLRSAYRGWSSTVSRNSNFGFRVARTLTC